VVAPPAPCTKRDTNSSAISQGRGSVPIAHSEQASANRACETAEIETPSMSIGRRPWRSESRPQTGEVASCATAKAEIMSPTRNGEAPRRVA
jgi:hypothetical protein